MAGLGVDGPVVDAFQPGSEQLVELDQVPGPTPRLQLDQELLSNGAEEALDLAPAGGMAGSGVRDADTEHGQGAVEGRGDERAAVVNEGGPGDAGGVQPSPQRRLQAHGVLAVAPAPARHRPAPVVDEGEQDGLGPVHHRAVHAVAGPQLAELGRLEAAQRPGRLAIRPHIEAEAGKVALDGPLRDLAPAGLRQSPSDLGRGPPGCFALEHLGRL
jgi:hypothetical protein